MTTRTWIGGGNNQASNPNDWSPRGVPQQGDIAVIPGGTINISGTDLLLFDPSGNSDVKVEGTATLNLTKDAKVIEILVSTGHATVNVKTDANFFLQTNVSSSSSATVDLSANSHWIGQFSGFAGSIVINGAPHATFITSGLSGDTQVGFGAVSVLINADIGAGSAPISANLGSTVEVAGSVAQGQVLLANGATMVTPYPPAGIIRIDHPNLFSGSLQIGEGEIDLNGLVADSYTYVTDMLTLYSGSSIVYKVPLQQVADIVGSPSPPIAVEATKSGVSIYSANDPNHPAGTLLLNHMGS